MRFYRPTIKEPISTFVEAPLAFIQGQMMAEQKVIDDTQKAIAEGNKEYLGVKPGQFSQDLYREFQKKYQNKFAELSDQLLNDPSKAQTLSYEIAKLNNDYKNDSLYTEINKDFLNYTQASQKLAGTDKPYYFARTSQLKLNPDGTVEGASPKDYMTYTDQDLYKNVFEEVSKFKPNERTENGKTYIDIVGPDGKVYTQEKTTTTNTEELTGQRIQAYLDERFDTANVDGSLEYNVREAATKAGNLALASSPEFRRQVFDNMVAPIIQQQYQKKKTSEELGNLSQSVNNSSRGSLGGNPPESVQPKIISGTTQAKNATPVSSKTGSSYQTPTDIVEDVQHIQLQENKAAATIAEITQNVLGKKLVTVADWQNLNSKFKTVDGKLVPLDEEAKQLLNAYGFQEAYGLRETLNQTKKNTQAFYDKITEGQDFDSKILKEAKQKAELEILSVEPSVKKSSIKLLQEMYPNKTSEEIENIWKNNRLKESENIINEKIKNNIPKNSNEYKVYERLEAYNERLEDVELRALPSSSKEAQDLKGLVLDLLEGDKAGSFKDMVTNKTADIKELIEKIPKDSNGNNDLSNVHIGYFADPDEGMKSFIMFNGSTYEFNMDDSSMQAIVQALDPTEATRFNVYNQAMKTITASHGQEGKIAFPDGVEFNFKEVQDRKNSKDFKYEYVDQYGVTRKVNSVRDMMNDLFNFKQNLDQTSSEIFAALQKEVKSGNMTQNEANQKMLAHLAKAKAATSQMGKSQEWVQSPKKPLQ